MGSSALDWLCKELKNKHQTIGRNIIRTMYITNDEGKTIVTYYVLSNDEKNPYIDIYLKVDDNSYFLGRYNEDYNILSVKYKNGLALIYNKYIEDGKEIITDIYGLYNTEDDMFLVLSKEEALKTFDSDISHEFLHSKNKLIVRSDLEKKNRLK